MAKKRKPRIKSASGLSEPANGGEPQSLPIVRKGFKTSADFNDFIGALMGDIIEGRITPRAANATNNSASKLLRMLDLTYKYGNPAAAKRTLVITEGSEESDQGQGHLRIAKR